MQSLRWILSPAAFIACFFVGCGGEGPQRVVVSGQVSYQGQPVPFGEIRFMPTAGTMAPMSGGHIVDGRYKIAAKGGVPLGTHRIEITGYREPPSTGGEADAPTIRKQYVPDKYNKQSELQLTVDAGQSEMKYDLQLE